MHIYDFIPAVGRHTDWSCFESSYASIVKKLTDTPQDPYFHSEGDVWIHTKLVVDSLTSNKEWQILSENDRRIVYIAALFHDIAKPLCTEINGDRVSSPGHSRKGSIDTRLFLYNLDVSFSERELICRLIGSHQKPFFIMTAEDPVFELRKLSREMPLNLLYLLANSDAEGRYTNPVIDRQTTLDTIAYSRMLAEDENIFQSAFQPADENTWLLYLDRHGANIDPRYSIYRNDTPFEVFVMCGLPGMGKDYWIAKNHSHLPVVSYDATREAMGLLYGDDQGSLANIVKDQAKSYLRSRQSFIWNATHISPSMRQKTLSLLHAYGAYVHIVYIEAANSKLWRTQNKSRIASVPDKALDDMLFKWEVPLENEAHQVDYIINNVYEVVHHRNLSSMASEIR